MMLWELRLRTPRGVDNVMIETFTADEVEARTLGERYIDDLASPSVRYVGVRPIVVKSSLDVPALVAQYGPPGTAPAAPAPVDLPAAAVPLAAPVAEPDRVPPMSGDVQDAQPAVAVDSDDVGDEMSGPRVANPRPGPKRSRV